VDEWKEAGSYQGTFESTIGNRQLANGIYIYRIQAGNYIDTKKMILMR
jgi:hypothetical protein